MRHLHSMKSVCGRLVRAFRRTCAATSILKCIGFNWYLKGNTHKMYQISIIKPHFMTDLIKEGLFLIPPCISLQHPQNG